MLRTVKFMRFDVNVIPYGSDVNLPPQSCDLTVLDTVVCGHQSHQNLCVKFKPIYGPELWKV